MNSCLFVVDVQNGFVNQKTKFLVERIQALLKQDRFDYTVFTQFKNESQSPYQTILNWHRLSESEEQELVDEIKPYAKHTFSKGIYSAITEETLHFLKSRQITEVHLSGIDTDCCVLKTAVDLFEHQFHPYVLAHYCASNGGAESHAAAIKVLGRLIGKQNIILTPLS